VCGLADQSLINTIYDSFRTGPVGTNSAPDPVCSLFANFVAGERTTGQCTACQIAAIAGRSTC